MKGTVENLAVHIGGKTPYALVYDSLLSLILLLNYQALSIVKWT